MIRAEAIQALRGIVGFKQPVDPNYAFLDSDNLQSDSGKYYEDISGIVTVKNIIDTYEYQDSLTDDQRNDILDSMRDSAAGDVLTEIFNDKSYIQESNVLFPYEQDYQKTIILENDFNYIEIKHLKKGITTNINNIILSFDSDVTFDVYLYESTTKAPVQTQSVTTSAGEDVKVYLGWNLDSRYTYRMGYKTSEIGTAKPYLRDYELSTVEELSRNICFDYYTADFNGARLDLTSESSKSDAMGMNLEYSVYIDWTREIIKNKNLFAKALQLQMALTVADRIMTTTASNITQQLTQQSLERIGYIIGNAERGTGLKGQFRKEVLNIKKFFFPEIRIMKKTIA
jgi:hypothetical protein